MMLKQKYNREDFLEFQKQFLPDFKKDIRRVTSSGLKATENVVLLGQSEQLDLHVFEFTHKATTDARVSLAADGFRVMKDHAISQALAVYQSESSNDWRLSLMTATLDINPKGRITQTFSNPRRYSFFLGPEARIHTPEEFLIKQGRVKNQQDLVSRFDVEIVTKEFFQKYKALFESLQKFLDKDHAFTAFAEKNAIDIDAFAKKILGQIVFCYFLQKKGWLGAKKGEAINKGDKDFMRSLFTRAAEKEENFYNEYLEPLFYDSLNAAPEESGDFYRNYFGSQIPFLNGGLFEPLENYDWKKSFLHIPNTLFSSKQGMGILDVFDLYNFTVYEDDPVDREVSVDPEMLGKVFENLLPENIRKGQGAYYTPREIVHYMCQESLTNHLITETGIEEKNIRKLITSKEHLFTSGEGLVFSPAEAEKLDNALSYIKVCDPACGSGAFLVVMLHEIVMARRVLNPKLHEYRLKKEAIQNSIYGVDIDPGAVEIAKLRLWLSLVVDYELEDIEPLPNLDYKIMCGNSLLEELVVGDETINLFDERLLYAGKKKSKGALFEDDGIEVGKASSKDEALQKRLKEKRDEMLRLNDRGQLTPQVKKGLDKEIAEILKEMSPKKKSKQPDYSPGLFMDKAEEYFSLLKELHKRFFSESNSDFKKKIRRQIEQIELEFIKSSVQEKIDNIEAQIKSLNMDSPDSRKKNAVFVQRKLEYSGIPDLVKNSKSKPYFLWKLNFFEVFQESKGFDVVVANPPYLKERDNKDVFEIVNKSEFGKLYHQGKMDYWYYFLHKAINLAKQDGIISYITSRYWINSRGAGKLIQRLQDEISFLNVIDIGNLKVFDEVSGHHMVVVYQKNKMRDMFVYKKLENDISDIGKYINTANVKIQELSNGEIYQHNEIMFQKDDFELEKTTSLGEVTDITQGVVQNPDKVSRKASEEYKLNQGEGVFVLTKKEYSSLPELSKSEVQFIRNFYDEKDIGKYIFNRQDNKYLIYLTRANSPSIEKFPGLKQHLAKFKKIMDARRETKKGTVKWFQLHWPREERFFENAKIVIPSMFKQATATFIAEPAYFGLSTNLIITKDLNYNLKYLLAIINSNFALYWFYRHGKQRGVGVDIGVDKLRSFPIRKAVGDEQKPLIEMVDKVLVLKESKGYCREINKQKKVEEYEAQIDQMVYKLYGLTDDEIKIVEESIAPK